MEESGNILILVLLAVLGFGAAVLAIIGMLVLSGVLLVAWVCAKVVLLVARSGKHDGL